MDYNNRIKEAFYNTDKNLLPAKLNELISEDNVDKKLFLVTCLNVLPNSTCTDFLIYSYKIFTHYTINDWLSLTGNLSLTGKYTLRTFLKSYTSFNAESLDKIGLGDTAQRVHSQNDEQIIDLNIESIKYKDSSLMLKTVKALGLTENDIIKLRDIQLR